MFDDTRTMDLLNNALDWIWEHTNKLGRDEYVRALKHIGMTQEEIFEILGPLEGE